MSDFYINETGLQAIKTWAESAFPSASDFNDLDSTVQGIVSTGGEANKIEKITMNGTEVEPDSNRVVALTNPTKTSDLTNDGDGTSNFATESYVTTNGGKIDKITVNGTEQAINNKTVALTVPTKVSDLTNDGDGTSGSKFATESYVDTNGGKIDTIKVNGTAQTITSKAVDITVPTAVSDLTNDSGFQTASDVQSLIDTAVTSAFKYKGSVATVSALPATGNEVGDVYDVLETGVNYAWDGTTWDPLGTYVDMSLYWAKTELTAMTVARINEILNA